MQYIQVFYYESEWCAHPCAFFIVHCAALNIWDNINTDQTRPHDPRPQVTETELHVTMHSLGCSLLANTGNINYQSSHFTQLHSKFSVFVQYNCTYFLRLEINSYIVWCQYGPSMVSPWHGFKAEYRWRYFIDNFCILYKIVESFSPQKQIFQIRQ